MTQTSQSRDRANDFESWLAQEFAVTGAFTAFVILVEIAGTRVTPLCSTFFNVIGDEVAWSEVVNMFSGSGRLWDGAAFFPATADDGGPFDNEAARSRLRALESRIEQDRLALNEGRFFDTWGCRMRIDEVGVQ